MFVDFGTPQTSAMSDPAQRVNISMNQDFYWSANGTGVAFGDFTVNNTYKYKGGEVYSIMDSGTSALLLTSDFFIAIVQHYMARAGITGYKILFGKVFLSCYSPDDLPSLYFQFSGYWIEIHPRDLFIDVSQSQNGGLCMMLIQKNSYPFNLFGAPMLRGYYTTHDPVKSIISFVPTPNSPKLPLPSGPIPEQELEIDFS